MNDTLFKKLYNNLYNLHPEESNNPKLKYVNRSWFFPNHLDITIDCIKNCVKKYNQGANLEIALYGGFFHDAGLVYKRESAFPEGHESRSIEYAKNELEKSGYKKEFIELVIEVFYLQNLIISLN